MKGTTDEGAPRPRLLILASTYPRWEGDHEPGFVHELAKRLTGEFDVTVLCPHAPGALAIEDMNGVEVIRYRYAPARWETLVNDGGIVTNLRRAKWKLVLVPIFLLAQALTAWRLSRRYRFDTIHAHWLIPQGLIAAALQYLPGRNVPFVVTSHGADLYALKGRVMNALKRFVLRRAAAVTVVSGAMRDELAAMGEDASRISVQPMGVDLSERFTPDPNVVRSTDEILFVGRLVEKKGLRHLIDAMPAILATRPSICLSIVGFGPEEIERRDQVEQLGLQGNVRFLGAVRQDDLPGLYRRAAVFVAPFVEAASGDREGLGLVLIEAAGCGCPVMVSDLPAVRQVFPNAAGASFVSPGNPVALATAVLSALATRHSVTDSEMQRLRDEFDWNSRARHYSNILKQAFATR